jgi:flagellar motor switch protein FliM
MLGEGSSGAGRRAQVTSIEAHMLEGVMQILAHELRVAWSSCPPISFELESVETALEDCRISAGEFVVVLTALWAFSGATATMELVIPSLLVRELGGNGGRAGREPKSKQRILATAKRSQVRADVRMPDTLVLARDVLQLRPGQVLLLPHAAGKALDMTINGIPKFRGQMVADEHSLKFRIEQMRAAER